MFGISLADMGDAELVSQLLRRCFEEQAQILGLTQESCPRYVAFETPDVTRKRMVKGERVLIACCGDQLVGTVSFDRREQSGELKRLGVLPTHRGNGYGTMLVEVVERELSAEGVERIELSLVAQFGHLQRFYERLGYRAAEIRTYPDLPFEILDMQKIILHQDGAVP